MRHRCDAGCALESVVVQKIGRDAGIFVNRLGVIDNIRNRSDSDGDQLGFNITVTVGDAHREAVCAVVIRIGRVAPCTSRGVDACRAVG